MEFTKRKPSLAPRVDRGETRVDVGDVIVDPDGMANTQGPQGRISNFRPVNSRMEQHGASHGHNSTNTTFGFPVLMVTASARVKSDLGLCLEMCPEG